MRGASIRVYGSARGAEYLRYVCHLIAGQICSSALFLNFSMWNLIIPVDIWLVRGRWYWEERIFHSFQLDQAYGEMFIMFTTWPIWSFSILLDMIWVEDYVEEKEYLTLFSWTEPKVRWLLSKSEQWEREGWEGRMSIPFGLLHARLDETCVIFIFLS